MNILIVSYIYPTPEDNRIGIFVHEQAKELVNQGHNVRVITSNENKRDEVKKINNITVYRLNCYRFFKGLIFNFKMLNRIIKFKGKIDIIHIHFIGLNSFFCWLGSKFLHIPVVATTHGIDVYPRNFFRNLLIRFYLLFPNKIMAVSNYTASLVKSNSKENKVCVVHNGVDVEKLKITKDKSSLRRKLGLGNNPVLLSVGVLVERKGIDLIIRALPEVIKKVPNLVYLIIGKGAQEHYLKNLVKSLNLQNHVRFLGFISSEELANYYNLCDVFILMSKTIKKKSGVEGFGIVYIEASYLGKPVIGGKSGGTGDAIIDGITGYRVDPDNSRDLTKKLILLLKNKNLRYSMGKQGKKFVKKKLLWRHNVEKTLKVYKEVID